MGWFLSSLPHPDMAVTVTVVDTLIVTTATPLPPTDATPTHARSRAREAETARTNGGVEARGIAMATTRVIILITGTADTPIRSIVTPVARDGDEMIIVITPGRSTQTITTHVVTVMITIQIVTVGRDPVRDILGGHETMMIGRHGDINVVHHDRARVLARKNRVTLARDTERRVVVEAARKGRRTRKRNATGKIVRRTTTVLRKSPRK